VNFTREPIIETIISPKEGYKLLVRSSKSGSDTEEYYVDAVEVVSFGHAFFFRSTERPKAFLVPASDYEVLEVKEVRVALKNVSHERNIKIGGGREASLRHSHREPPQERKVVETQEESVEEEQQPVAAAEAGLESAGGGRMDKRRDRRRRRHRRSGDEQEWSDRRPVSQQQESPQMPESKQQAQGGGAEDEAKVSSSLFSSLIPPPTTLISAHLGRYKDKEFMQSPPSKEVEQKEEKKKKEPPEDVGSESAPLNRVSASHAPEQLESNAFTSTHFSPLQGGMDNFLY